MGPVLSGCSQVHEKHGHGRKTAWKMAVTERLKWKKHEIKRFFNSPPPPFLAIQQFSWKDLNRTIDGTVLNLR
jgi:hypothetical protein